MRLSIVLLFALSAWVSAQTRGIGYIPSAHGVGGGARVVRPVGGRGLYGGWGWGGYGGGSTNITVMAPGEREAGSTPRSVLNTSSTYTPDRPKPELRVYDMLPAPGEVGQGAPVAVTPQKGPEQVTPTVYLIAFRKGGVESVYTYWFERDQLNFVTVHHDVKQVPVADLDRPLTELLNRKRGIEFR